jgi:hypothetical protein
VAVIKELGAVKLRPVGKISAVGEYHFAFLFPHVAITVTRWVEHGTQGPETGCRIQLQRLETEVAGTEFAAPRVTFTQPIWRGDLFTLATGQPGNWAKAHFHPNFEGIEPSKRAWDAALTESPLTWLERELEENFETILREGGAADLVGLDDTRLVREATPHIMDAVRNCAPNPDDVPAPA